MILCKECLKSFWLTPIYSTCATYEPEHIVQIYLSFFPRYPMSALHSWQFRSKKNLWSVTMRADWLILTRVFTQENISLIYKILLEFSSISNIYTINIVQNVGTNWSFLNDLIVIDTESCYNFLNNTQI